MELSWHGARGKLNCTSHFGCGHREESAQWPGVSHTGNALSSNRDSHAEKCATSLGVLDKGDSKC